MACYHGSKGNLAGALTLARSASRYLNAYGPVYQGLGVEGFVTKCSELFAWLRRHPQRFDPYVVPPPRWSGR